MDRNDLAKPTRFALLGAGSVGTAVALLLQKRGHTIAAVTSRSRSSAEEAGARLGAPTRSSPSELPPVDAVLVGTPDRALPVVAEELARWEHAEGAIVIHFAGALGAEVFRPVIVRGAEAAALHPVQACPDVDAAVANLPGSAWGVTTTDGAGEWARSFVTTLQGMPVQVREQDRALWHAAAVTTSNGVAALLALGEAMLRRIGVGSPAEVLGPLAAGTLQNALRGAGDALTGPLVRGDVATIEGHLETLSAAAPELLPGYLAAGATILEAAIRAGRIDASDRDAMRRLLEPVIRREPAGSLGVDQ